MSRTTISLAHSLQDEHQVRVASQHERLEGIVLNVGFDRIVRALINSGDLKLKEGQYVDAVQSHAESLMLHISVMTKATVDERG